MLYNVRQKFYIIILKSQPLQLSLFEKRIHPKHLQNLRMVLSILCNDDKMCGNKLLELSRYKCIPKVILSHPISFGERTLQNVGKVVIILSVLPTFYCSVERSFCVLRIPKTNLKSILVQNYLIHLALLCIERTYVNRLDIEKVIDEFSSEKGRSKFIFQPMFRPEKHW